MVKKIKTKNKLPFLLSLLLIVALTTLVVVQKGYFKPWADKIFAKRIQPEPKDLYFDFLSEIYNKIKVNYWNKISDGDLSKLFLLAAEKVTPVPQKTSPGNLEEIKDIWKNLSATASARVKKDYAVKIASLVLGNLEPFGRSGLYTQKDEQALKNTVQNVNVEKDLYKDLGVGKEASEGAIKQAFEKQVAELSQQTGAEAQNKLKEIEYAHKVLTDQVNKQIYDKTGGEPTVSSNLINPSVAYLKIKQMSPATLQEFVNRANGIKDSDNLNSLILDLRGDIGGSIDILPYFLGPFIGPNRYAYDFFHQGDLTPFKTLTDWLPSFFKYKKVVILIDGGTQSTAEVLAATLKKYNVGVLLGSKTRGWGTVEKVFNIDSQITPEEKYSVFLVHSLTLREDGKAIEGAGVDPVIDIKNPNWEKELNEYYNFPPLIDAVKKVLQQKT